MSVLSHQQTAPSPTAIPAQRRRLVHKLDPAGSHLTGAESTVEANGLLAAIAAGDTEAFKALYDLYAGRAYRTVHAVVRDHSQAEEVTQEVFLALWRHAGKFDPSRGSVANYITMLGHSKAVERVRSSQAARNRDDNYGTSNLDRSEHHDPVFEGALLNDEHAQIRLALNSLTPLQREAIELHYFGRHSYVEVGRLLSVSVAAVKARIRSGVTQLRADLAAAG